ncbi:hypothetical protein GQ53DRAFT_889507 [Thozetella sp. PMI_491]|nr:hypothetical protein GQ53DRAFT_889507 [Thozetella sp. PMI_491]
MRLSTLTALLVACAAQAQAAAVFAHFMVGNANNYTLANWEYDMTQAKNAHIDAFALNIANHDTSIYSSLALAFQAASAVGFQLFFSFDFAGGGAWDYNSVHTICSAYFGNSHYYHYNGLPFVSTFEGPDQSKLWADIKAALPCFFVPDWSSLGAEKAVQLGVFDGLFSWAAWPWGDRSMDTYGDGSYKQFLGGKPYMMPVAPWFFTNLPGYSKNWLWRGDDLWYDRWVQAIHWQPEFIEIISWNDYGESHYIGPLYDNAMAAFTIGKAPYNYAAGMPHDGWRQFLPFLIDTYKNGIATITQEGLTAWYRTSPGTACGSGGTSGNTATQLQLEMSPATIMEDKIFYSALLGSAATVTVTVGGVNLGAGWTSTPIGGAGMYHGSVSFAGHTGAVVITLSRGGMQISNGPAISTSCTKGITNWNAWVGSSSGGSVTATPTLKVSQEVCMKGTGNNNFKGLCEYACGYGYCPWQACVCTSFGTQVPTPSATWPVGYPLANEDTTYNGLCSFCCNHGYCPPTACSTNFVSVPVATWDDFANPACVGGTGSDNVVGLCQYGCPRGYCPMNACTCTATGTLAAQEPADTTVAGVALSGEDPALYNGLCNYACQRGYCPPQAYLSSLQSTFYPASADSASDMQLTMIMHGIGAALGIMLAVIPEPWAPALSAAMTGAIDIFTDSLQDDSNIAEQILSNTIVVAGE